MPINAVGKDCFLEADYGCKHKLELKIIRDKTPIEYTFINI